MVRKYGLITEILILNPKKFEILKLLLSGEYYMVT